MFQRISTTTGHHQEYICGSTSGTAKAYV